MGIRVIQHGVGYCGQKAIELMLRKDIEVVAAIGHRNRIGKDIGELVGLGKVGVKITDAEVGPAFCAVIRPVNSLQLVVEPESGSLK